MGKLIYSAICSLDGFIEDAEGKFDWAAPDEEVHAFVNDLERPIGTYLYGRRMYEVMRFWETAHEQKDQEETFLDYARVWQAAEKVVFSTTLREEDVNSSKTRLEREFDPGAVREMKDGAGADLSVGGPGLAAEALQAGVVDEISLFLNPIVIGSGKPALPGGLRLELDLLDERRFASGVVYLRHRVRDPR